MMWQHHNQKQPNIVGTGSLIIVMPSCHLALAKRAPPFVVVDSSTIDVNIVFIISIIVLL